MPTANQLVRKGRRKRGRIKRNRQLGGNPQLRGVVTRVFVADPVKPNSGERNCVRVRLTNGKEVTALVPGEQHRLQEHSQVLVRGNCKARDLRGVKYAVVRGALDDHGVEGRKQSRSVYGAKRPK